MGKNVQASSTGGLFSFLCGSVPFGLSWIAMVNITLGAEKPRQLYRLDCTSRMYENVWYVVVPWTSFMGLNMTIEKVWHVLASSQRSSSCRWTSFKQFLLERNRSSLSPPMAE